VSEKQEEKKAEKHTVAKAHDTALIANEVLDAVETYRRSLDPVIPVMKAFQDQMSAQAEIIRRTMEMVRRTSIPADVLQDLRMAMDQIKHPIGLSDVARLVPRVVANVDMKLLRYLELLEAELAAERAKNRKLLEMLGTYKKKLKEKPDYIK